MAGHDAHVIEPQDTGPSDAALSPARTVLVVACDSTRPGAIGRAFRRRGYPAVEAEDAPQALYWARREPLALSILDARVKDWRPLARDLQEEGRRVLVLADDPGPVAAALEEGCMTAPLDRDPDEIATRAATLLKPASWGETERASAGPLVADLSRDLLIWDGSRIPAPRLLVRLAAYLVANAGRIVPTRELLEEVWGQPWAQLNKVHQAVWRLRQVLGLPPDSEFLVGRQRHGYAILPEATPIAAGRGARTPPAPHEALPSRASRTRPSQLGA